MRILFYNHTGQVSGAERLLLMILSRIDRDSFDPIVVCPEQESLSDLVSKLGVPVETIAALKARFTWRVDQLALYCKSFFQVTRQFRNKVISLKPDLIHANSIRAGLVATVATLGLETPVIWHVHDILPRHPLSSLVRIAALISSRSRMIAVSRAVAANFSGRFPRLLTKRIGVILNAIDFGKFRRNKAARQIIGRELRLRPEDRLIGIVGQLTPRKGQLELLHAFRQALDEMPDSVLLIVGAPIFNRDHEYLKLLEQTATELGISERVRMVGSRTDIDSIMQALDLLIVNSNVEAFGLVILEARVCGTPVLAAAVGGIPEIIEHGVNGWLVPPRDESEMARAIVHLGRRPELAARLAKQGSEQGVARFSADRYMTELQAFYHSHADLRSTVFAESGSRQAADARCA
ncbi:MAG TPA: glycosyltransferase family 4 protein [Pyrinomonadaceae bacterium]